MGQKRTKQINNTRRGRRIDSSEKMSRLHPIWKPECIFMKAHIRIIHLFFALIGISLILGGLVVDQLAPDLWTKVFSKNVPFPFSPHALELFGHTVTEVGVGFVVAIVVSMIWDLHHRQNVEKRLQQLANDVAKTSNDHERKLEEHCDKIAHASGRIEDSLSTVLENYAPMVQTLVENHVENVFRRYDKRSEHKQEINPRLLDHLIASVKNAKRFILLGGRAFNDSLWARNAHDERLLNVILERIRSVPDITVFVLYGSTAHSEESDLLLEYKFRRREHSDMLNEQRKTLHALFNRFAELISMPDNKTKLIDVRALKLPPAFWLLATESYAFFDPYLPFRNPGETFVFKVGQPSNMPDVDVQSLARQCEINDSGQLDRQGVGLSVAHSIWDLDGDVATDSWLYMRIVKSFIAQFVVRGTPPSLHFQDFLDRNRSVLSGHGIKKWEEIIRAAQAIESNAKFKPRTPVRFDV